MDDPVIELSWRFPIRATSLVLYRSQNTSDSDFYVGEVELTTFLRDRAQQIRVSRRNIRLDGSRITVDARREFDRVQIAFKGEGIRLGEIEVYGRSAAPPLVAAVRGDTSCDGAVNLSDVIGVLGQLFMGTGQVCCEAAGDSNQDGYLNLMDAIHTLQWLFVGGDAPAGHMAGTCEDLIADELSCGRALCP